MDDEHLRELLRSPLDDDSRRGRRWLPWVAGLAVGALVVAGVFLFTGDEPVETAAVPAAATSGTDAGLSATTTTLPGVPGLPESMGFHQLVFDPVGSRMILTSGTEIVLTNPNQSGRPAEGTWAYDPATQEWFDYQGGPPARAGYAAASTGDRVVLFGGSPTALRVCGVFGPCRADALGDTWLMDPATGVWEEVSPATAPSERYGAALAYDEQSDVLILFGGAVMSQGTFANDALGDTWAYDLAGGEWSELKPENPPPARAWHRMSYDPAADRILMFGGTGGGELDGRVWSYDTEASRWEASNAAGPDGRWTPISAFDVESGLLVVAGGQGPVVRAIGEGVSATELRWRGDVWTYDYQADAWTELPPLEGVVPWSSGAYDPVTDRVIAQIFGFTGILDADSGTWEFVEPGDPEEE